MMKHSSILHTGHVSVCMCACMRVFQPPVSSGLSLIVNAPYCPAVYFAGLAGMSRQSDGVNSHGSTKSSGQPGISSSPPAVSDP